MKYNHGFILGKFYPPHMGHLHLIREARKECYHLTVMVSTLKRELIPGSLRFKWMKELTKEMNLEVIWIEDENPQYPEEHSDFWNIWKKSITSRLKEPIDVLFTSETYGEPLSKVLGTKHVLVDIDRKIFPVSATNIRQCPANFWQFIPALIQPYFLKRVVITGSESVGKSTLAKEIAPHFRTDWVSEYGRDFLETKGRTVREEDILEIGKGHLKMEIEKSKIAKQILFLDTDLITTKIYSEYYFKSCPTWVSERASKLVYDDSFLLDIDVPWIPDPQRDLEANRDEMKNIFLSEMRKSNRDFHLLSGNFDIRLSSAIALTDSILKLPMNPIYFTDEQMKIRNDVSSR